MRSAKSTNSLATNLQQQQPANNNLHQPETSSISQLQANNNGPTSPICRCRVMYLGSSVPHITKDGLQGIQEPLRELYPDKASLASGNAGIDSWLSVWSNGILIENVDETGHEVKRFFKIDALHYCAAVKFVPSSPSQQLQQLNNPYTTLPNGNQMGSLPRFLPLDSPHARQSNLNPPIFASIIRRTTGIKVLECHAFICKREAAANALVRCCFHAYADTMYAKQIGADVNSISTINDVNNNHNHSKTHGDPNPMNIKHYDMIDHHRNDVGGDGGGIAKTRRSKSIAALNDTAEPYTNQRIRSGAQNDPKHQLDRHSMNRQPSMNEQQYMINCDNNDNSSQQLYSGGDNSNNNINNQLRKQQSLSKSMHHLNQTTHQNMGMTYQQLTMEQANDYGRFMSNQSTSASCINGSNNRCLQQKDSRFNMQQVVNQQPPFYNPQASRVPSYPPQNLMDSANGGGTLRSIKSMAANSIASTLLRSKKHAKAMSMAQLNHDKVTSFHQPQNSNASTMMGGKQTMMMPPVPPMFMPNLPAHHRPIMNGSQTMKPHSKTMMPFIGLPMNYEAMTPKEMKKLLKKSAKNGIDPNKFGQNGLPPLPLRLPPASMHPPPPCHMSPLGKSGTMISKSMFLDMYGNRPPEMLPPDMANPIGGQMLHNPQGGGPLMADPMMMEQAMMKPILVKPNPDFLKSKAGKKWLKQQKEFKKLLPPHLDGLPIIFGPPPVDALESATDVPQNNLNNIQKPPFIGPPQPPQHGLPMMDSSGYYNPHPFYGQNGRASAASTLLRYSPNSQLMHDNANSVIGPPYPLDPDYLHKANMMYNQNGNNSGANMPNPYLLQPTRADYSHGDSSSMVFANNGNCSVDLHHHHQRNYHLENSQQKRHMIEQSVISLGDENDYDDEDETQQHQHEQEETDENEEEHQNGYYSSASIHGQELNNSRRSRSGGAKPPNHQDGRANDHHAAINYQDSRVFNQQQQSYTEQNNDDQSSYSSGIYKRGHINERAFSYSIRQEHKSSNPSANYATRNETLTGDNGCLDQGQQCHMQQQQQQQQQHTTSNMSQGKRDHNDEYYHHHHHNQQQHRHQNHDNNDSQTLPVNELTARLESQLNMKSFANSRIKSQM